MCSITGIYAFNQVGWIFGINLTQATEAIRHRGPDFGKLYVENKTGMGASPLAIIDLSSDGNQPMIDPTERYAIVFNGEIYNFLDLRVELEQKGVVFHSNCDTEVLLQLYIHEGEKCLEKLVGFFAFAVHDRQEDTLFIARDRLGIKPLYYFLDEDKLIFGSEMSALLGFRIPKEIDYTSVYQYFQLSYIPAPYTIFKDVFKLKPGHYMKVKGREIEIKPFYHIPEPHGSYAQAPSYEAAQKQLLELLDESVRLRLIADVPFGAFLSGGIDSSTIVALASKHTTHLNTFSIGYRDEPMFDETRYAELVAKKYNTQHTVFKLSNDDLFEHIPQLLDFYAEPFADASQIPTYILCKQTHEKVTVALSGDGADEVFGGYNKYMGEYRIRQGGLMPSLVSASMPLLEALPKNRNTPFGNKVRQLHRFASAMKLSPQERYWMLSTWRTEQEAMAMLSPEVRDKIDMQEYQRRKAEAVGIIKGTDFNEVLYADQHLVLPNDMLHKVDSMSMAHALEVRVPFLDHRVVNFAAKLPASYKIDAGMKKKLLQDAVRHLLPTELYKRPKHGFDVPLAKGYKRELKGWVEQLLDKDLVAGQQFFDPAYIAQLKQSVFNTSNFDQNQVWALLAFQQWWKKIFKI